MGGGGRKGSAERHLTQVTLSCNKIWENSSSLPDWFSNAMFGQGVHPTGKQMILEYKTICK